MRFRQNSHSGFTLLELVVVIAVLAILATIAVRSLGGVEDQSRFDATRNQLTALETAVIDSPIDRDADGSAQALCFVGDLGRLPLAVGTDPTTQLQELWANPRNLLPLAVRTAPSDSDVLIASGWRGGYLRLGVNQTSIRDGWGNAYDLLHADGATPCADGDPVEIVRSRGADGIIDTTTTTGFNADQYEYFNSTVAPVQNRYVSDLTGTVYFYNPATGQVSSPDPANGNVTVMLFGPDPPTGGVLEQTFTITAPFTAATYSFPTATVGPRVLRAYQGTGTPAPFRSIPVRLIVQAGAQTKDLTLLTTPSATTQPTPGS
jgi:prepilin-type N-terminal cleavage/methylation domain-containing protein